MGIILNTDSYKTSHFKQYPPGAQRVYSYGESRGIDEGASFYQPGDNQLVFFGLQMFLRKYMTQPAFTYKEIYDAEKIYAAHGVPFNKEGWEYLWDTYRGKLPLSIYAVPEGTVMNTQVPLFAIVNNDPKVPWLTNYVETSLLRAVWYPTTVATNS